MIWPNAVPDDLAPPKTMDEAAPLTVPLHEAVRRTGCRNAAQFWREIKRGIWPAPMVNSRPPRWSVAALERAAGARPSSDNAGEEAALAALDNWRP